MRNMLRVGAFLGALLLSGPALAQSFSGELRSGSVLGNPAATDAPATDATMTSMFDRAFCGTNGGVITRTAGTWGCATMVSTGTTAAWNVNPTALSVIQGIKVAQTSPTTGSTTGEFRFNEMNCSSGVKVTTGGGTMSPFDDRVAACHKITQTVQANAGGFQIPLLLRLNHNVATNLWSGSGASDFVTLGIHMHSNAADNSATGSGTGAGMYGVNVAVELDSGAVHEHVNSINPQIIFNSGATSRFVIGNRLQRDGTGRATVLDAAISAMTLTDGQGWSNLIALNEEFGGAQSILTTGDVIRAHRPLTVANFANLSNLTVTGDIFHFPKLRATGSGTFSISNNSVAVASLPAAPSDTVLHITGADASPAAINIQTYGAAANTIPYFRGIRSRGTAAARTAVVGGDALANFLGDGYNGTGYAGGPAGMTVFAAETFGASNGAFVQFATTPIGGTTAFGRVRINDSGIVTITTNTTTALGNYPAADTNNVLRVIGVDGATARLEVDTFGAGAGGAPSFTGRAAGGTSATQSAVASGDVLASFFGKGAYGNNTYGDNAGAGVNVVANQAYTNVNQGTRLEFYSTANGASTVTQRGSIENDGGITWPRAVTGGSKGSGTINATALYQAGTQVVAGSLGSTDNVAVRADGTGGFTTQGSALVIADTTAALSVSGTSGVPVQGSSTNFTVAAGNVGQIIACTPVSSGSAISISPTNTQVTLCSISLTAGNWLMWCNPVFKTTGTTTLIYLNGSVSTAAATIQTGVGQYTSYSYSTAGLANTVLNNIGMPVGPYNISQSGTNTLYCTAQAGFAASTVDVYGGGYAMRIP